MVADIQLDQGPTSINRYDRERQATVAADLVGNAALGDATKKIYDLPVMKSLAEGRQGRARRATPKASTNCRKASPPRSPPA